MTNVSDLDFRSEILESESSMLIIHCDAQSVKLLIERGRSEVRSKSAPKLNRHSFAQFGLDGQKRMRPVQHVGEGVRLAYDIVDAGLLVVFFSNHFCETGGDDHRQIGPELFDPTRDVEAAQLGQAEIANHQIELA